jgi:uncharacterized hydrophobic protein (TIGR00341 family)
MSLQLIEAYLPKKYFEQVDKKLKKYHVVSYRSREVSEEQMLMRLLVKTEDSEEILNYLESASNIIDGFEIILFPVQTHIKRNTGEGEGVEKKGRDKQRRRIQRASRHELYLHIEGMSRANLTYALFVILSAVVVALGLIKNSTAVVIGGMVIAPLLGPVIALAFSSILGDFKLAKQAFISVVMGIALALAVSVLFSFIFIYPENSHEFLSRTYVDIADMILALASGAAGALAILKRLPGSLVGVMVAVALLPPTVVLGMSLGSLMLADAFGAMLLLLANITSILLSAIIVFSLTGIRPIKFEEIKRARNSKKSALLSISIIIILLVFAVIYSNKV